MTETEVERLVVRLIGDSSSFKKAFDDAAKATEEFKQATSELTKTEKLLEQQQQKIAQIMEQSKTSAQKYAEQIKELDALLNATTTAEERHAVSLRRSQVAQEAANAASGKSQQQYKDIGSSLTTAGTAIATVGAIITGSLVMLGKSAVDQAKEFEQTMISFEAMLGSQVKAKTLLTELTKFSAETPFTMPTLLSATKMLLQFQVPARDVMGILKSIGDVTGGSDAGKVQAMAYAFSQMSAAGRLMGQDLMQMINAGFNPLTEMSKTTGKSLAVLREEMSEGKITADMVKAAFASASERLDLMGKQAVTLGGRMSTLDDNIGLFWRSIGEQLLPLVGYVVDAFASWVKRFQDLDPWWKSFIAYAGLAAAILGTFTTVIGGTIAGLGFMITALSNAVIAINGLLLPLGIAITGMGLLIAMLGLGIVVATAVVVVAIVETSAAVQALNAEMETSLKLASRLGHVFDRGTKAIISEADSKTSPQKEEFLQTNFDQATKNVQGTTAALEEMKTQTAALEPSWMSLWQSGRRLWEASQQQVKETEEHLENLKKRAAAVQDELIKMKGTGFIEESIKKSDKELASLAVNLRKLQKEHETMTEWDNPLFYLSDTDEVNAQLEKIKAAKKEIESVTKNKDHLGDLKVEMEFKLSVQAEKTLTDLKKKIKNAGLSEAEIAARDIETLAGTKTGEAKKADMKQATELRAVGEAAKIAERGGAAITTIKEANRVFEEQASLVGKVGFARKRAELEIQIAQGLAMEGAHDNAVMFEQNATRRRQLVEEETQHITDMINKQEQQNKLIGLKGVALMEQQNINAGGRGFDQGEKDRAQIALDDEGMKKFVTEMQESTALIGLFGVGLEFAKMEAAGLFKNMTDVEKAAQKTKMALRFDENALKKVGAELDKQARLRNQTGVERFAEKQGIGLTPANQAAVTLMYLKSEAEATAVLIQKKSDELRLIGLKGIALEEMQREIDKKPAYTKAERDTRIGQINTEAVAKSTAALNEQLEVIQETGIAAHAREMGFDRLNATDGQKAELFANWELKKQVLIAGTIKKMDEEAAVLGKVGYEAFLAAEKFKGIVFSPEQEKQLKRAFDLSEISKMNDKYGPQEALNKYRKALVHIEGLRKQGLNDHAYMGMLKEAREELQKVAGMHKVGFTMEGVEGVISGSAAMERALMKARLGGGRVGNHEVAMNQGARRVQNAQGRFNLVNRGAGARAPQPGNEDGRFEGQNWIPAGAAPAKQVNPQDRVVFLLGEIEKHLVKIKNKPAIVFEEAGLI